MLTCHPGRSSVLAWSSNARLHRTSFNRVLLAGMRGKIKRYLAFPVTWVAGEDVAKGSIAALDRGVAGERYLLVGRPEDDLSTAGGINRACEIAGIDHRVEDLDYRTDPEALTAEFGPTLMAIAKAAARASASSERRQPDHPAPRLGPMSFDDGLRLLISWLRGLGRLDRCRLNSGLTIDRVDRDRTIRITAIWPIGSSTPPAAVFRIGRPQVVVVRRGSPGRGVTADHLSLLRVQRGPHRCAGNARTSAFRRAMERR